MRFEIPKEGDERTIEVVNATASDPDNLAESPACQPAIETTSEPISAATEDVAATPPADAQREPQPASGRPKVAVPARKSRPARPETLSDAITDESASTEQPPEDRTRGDEQKELEQPAPEPPAIPETKPENPAAEPAPDPTDTVYSSRPPVTPDEVQDVAGYTLVTTTRPFSDAFRHYTEVDGEEVQVSSYHTSLSRDHQERSSSSERHRELLNDGKGIITVDFKQHPEEGEPKGKSGSHSYLIAKPNDLSTEHHSRDLAALAGVSTNTYLDVVDKAYAYTGEVPDPQTMHDGFTQSAKDVPLDEPVIVATTYGGPGSKAAEVLEDKPEHAEHYRRLGHLVQQLEREVTVMEKAGMHHAGQELAMETDDGANEPESVPSYVIAAAKALDEANDKRLQQELPPLTVEQVSALTGFPLYPAGQQGEIVTAHDIQRLHALRTSAESWESALREATAAERSGQPGPRSRVDILTGQAPPTEIPEGTTGTASMTDFLHEYIRSGETPKDQAARRREVRMLFANIGITDDPQSFREIAAQEGISANRVTEIVHTARRRLALFVAQREREEHY